MNNRSDTPVTQTKRWISGTPQMLIYSPYATKRQLEIIGWLRDDFPRNKNEQGGWLIGRYLRDAAGHITQAEVLDIWEANTECRRPAYIEWDAIEEIRMQRKFFQIKDTLSATDPTAAEELAVIGWWHTHPNGLPVFMSGTDMETQRLKYFKPEKYAVVLNPHRGIWRAFAGREAVEAPAVMLVAEDGSDVPTKKQIDCNCRKQKRHRKKCTSRRKKIVKRK